MDLAALTFILASATLKGRRIAAEFVGVLAVPVLAQSGLFSGRGNAAGGFAGGAGTVNAAGGLRSVDASTALSARLWC